MRKAPRHETVMREVRAAEQSNGKPVIAHGACHFCDWALGKGALWCSSDCAQEYASEKAASAPQNAA